MPTQVDFKTGELSGLSITETVRTLADLKGIFENEGMRESQDPKTPVYRVQCWFPGKEGELGGLFWGSTIIEPGMIGDEYFMTKGHFHFQKDRGEYYITVAGQGALILMGQDRFTRMEVMKPGSVHYIPGFTAHRVANTGDVRLSFLACWPSDAGHDYQAIAERGFSARLKSIHGVPELEKCPQ